MNFTPKTALALAALAALGLAAPHPAAAQNHLYTLSGVTFADGATASGTFEFDSTTFTFGPYDIITTDGLTDSTTGAHYVQGTGFDNNGSGYFAFDNGASPDNYLALATSDPLYTPGVLTLSPGSINSDGSFDNSGEFAPDNVYTRVINSGSVIVGPAIAPVPEISSVGSLGVMLLLGAGGMAIARRKIRSA